MNVVEKKENRKIKKKIIEEIFVRLINVMVNFIRCQIKNTVECIERYLLKS